MVNGIKIGFTEWGMIPKLRGPSICRVAKDCGIDGIEVEIGDYTDNFSLANDYTRELYMEEAQRYGIEFPSMAFNTACDLSICKPRSYTCRTTAEYAARRAIETAQKMGIPLIHVPSLLNSLPRSKEDMDNTVEFLQYVCDYAADRNVTMATENVMSVQTNLELLERVNRENFKIYFDLQNYWLTGGFNTIEMIEPLLPYIAETHIKDGCDALSTKPLGQGEAQVAASLDKMLELGYRKWVVIENCYFRPLCDLGDDPCTFLKNDVAWLENQLKNSRYLK